MKALDLFAGAGGWDVAARGLGIDATGVEIMPDARLTRRAADLPTAYSDVWTGLSDESVVPEHDLLIASPPCQTFSAAGRGEGRRALSEVLRLMPEAIDNPRGLRGVGEGLDDRTALVLSPLAYVSMFRPDHVAMEQVPTVLPVWEAVCVHLRTLGYTAECAVVNAHDYGAPQSRKRAVLVASRRIEARIPEPTGKGGTMAEAIGWGITDRPSPTLTGHLGVTRSPSGTQRVYLDAIERGAFIFKPVEPVPSRVAKGGIGALYAPNTVNIDVEDGAVLQGFPRDHPFQGSKTSRSLQVGNAIPVQLAREVLRQFA